MPARRHQKRRHSQRSGPAFARPWLIPAPGLVVADPRPTILFEVSTSSRALAQPEPPSFISSADTRGRYMQSLPTLQTAGIQLPLAGDENVPALSREVRELAADRNAVILAHNYQVPEVQDVADYVGDSLGLSQKAAAAGADTIAFCGVHFMAETASILSPEKTVLLPDKDAGCSLADSITADQLREWKAAEPGRDRRDVRQHDRRGEGRDRLLRHLVERRRRRRAHPARARPGHRHPVRPRHVPRRLRREDGRPQDEGVGRRVPRARRHPPRRHRRGARASTRAPTS